MNNRNTQLVVITIVFFIVAVASGFGFYKYLASPVTGGDSLVEITAELKTYQAELEKCKNVTDSKIKANCDKYIVKVEKSLKEYEAKLGQLK